MERGMEIIAARERSRIVLFIELWCNRRLPKCREIRTL